VTKLDGGDELEDGEELEGGKLDGYEELDVGAELVEARELDKGVKLETTEELDDDKALDVTEVDDEIRMLVELREFDDAEDSDDTRDVDNAKVLDELDRLNELGALEKSDAREVKLLVDAADVINDEVLCTLEVELPNAVVPLDSSGLDLVEESEMVEDDEAGTLEETKAVVLLEGGPTEELERSGLTDDVLEMPTLEVKGELEELESSL
jgi:hypothetical protein